MTCTHPGPRTPVAPPLIVAKPAQLGKAMAFSEVVQLLPPPVPVSVGNRRRAHVGSRLNGLPKVFFGRAGRLQLGEFAVQAPESLCQVLS